MSLKITTLTVVSALALMACGGSSDNASLVAQVEPSFSFAISDAPVNDVSEVVVCFNTVELKYDGNASNDQVFTVGVDPQVLPEND